MARTISNWWRLALALAGGVNNYAIFQTFEIIPKSEPVTGTFVRLQIRVVR
jgi:hypothetical protein